MKICILEFQGATPGLFFAEERMINLRRLADLGLFGELPPFAGEPSSPQAPCAALWPQLSAACKNSALIVGACSLEGSSANSWTRLSDQMMNPDWEYIHFLDAGLTLRTNEDSALACGLDLDQHLGSVMEALDHDTALLVLGRARQGSAAAFVLASPNCPLTGAYQDAHLEDLAPTLLDLAGLPIPESISGRSLVAGLERPSPESAHPDDEKVLMDRLAGLGYV